MRLFTLTLALGAAAALIAGATAADKAAKPALTVIVMDPLAAPLSCPCVQGYAQRDYEKLGKFLETELGRPVTIAFSDSLTAALQKKTEGKADLVIGKDSVVRSDAKINGRKLTPVAQLTGKDGATTQTGLIVVASANPAKSPADLSGYRIFFGPADCDEKHAAALDVLKSAGVTPPTKLETCAGCDEGATKMLDLGASAKAAAVISSYAAPLLEGCNTVPKGALRVVGTTAAVPFVTAFTPDTLSAADRDALMAALLKVGEHPDLLKALETQKGFVRAETQAQKKSS